MAVRQLEDTLGRSLGDFHDPLLVSVRSGAKFSMPGMMETVLNVGLNDASVEGLAEFSGDERFAWDSYRRLIQMFGKTVLGIDGEQFSDALDAKKTARGVATDTDLTADDLHELVAEFKQIVSAESGREFPQHPREQLDLAIEAVFDSWNTDRARLYRRRERIPDDLGTAVNVVTMVFGNLGEDSGTGVCFTRDPSTGRAGRLRRLPANAQGEDVVAGIRNTLSLADFEKLDHAAYAELRQAMRRLETHYRDLCDIEFTVERGKLWMLQTRVGKRTAAAAFRIAHQLVEEHLITKDEALERVTGEQLSKLMFPQFDGDRRAHPARQGHGGLAGRGGGHAVFSSVTAQEWAEQGKDVILVRRETNPDDLGGMIAAVGVLTSRGGKTSHAAVVARGMGTTCVVGAEAAGRRRQRQEVHRRRARSCTEGDIIAIDGSSGEIFLGAVPVVPSPVVRYLEDGLETALAELHEDDEETRELVDAVDTILSHADDVRRLRVHANADTAEDAHRARAWGGQGIGLCRTEHSSSATVGCSSSTSSSPRTSGAAGRAGRAPAAAARGLHRAPHRDGRPADDDPADRPAAARVPARPHRAVRQGRAGRRARRARRGRRAGQGLLAAVEKHARGEPHARPARRAARHRHPGPVRPADPGDRRGAGGPAQGRRHPEGRDHDPARRVGHGAAPGPGRGRRDPGEVAKEQGVELDMPIGAMIELPRAAFTADRMADVAEFFSFGTNDLTQTTWGFSRDDVEGAFFNQYTEKGVFSVSPFETLDTQRRRRPGADGGREGARDAARHHARRVRRARWRPRVDPLLPQRRAGLRLLLAVPGADRAPRGRSGGRRAGAGDTR